MSAATSTTFCSLKGIVQRKVRCVESGVNRWLVLQYSGTVFGLFFKGTPSWIMQKNVWQLFELKLLVMWERIGEALQIVCEVLHTV